MLHSPQFRTYDEPTSHSWTNVMKGGTTSDDITDGNEYSLLAIIAGQINESVS